MPPRRKRAPLWIALLGAGAVALTLLLPNSARQAGDHEPTSCGNAFHIDMRDRSEYADDYYEVQRGICERAQSGRRLWAVGLAIATVVLVASAVAWGRRRVPVG